MNCIMHGKTLVIFDNNIFSYRDNEQLSKYGDTKSARNIMLGELKKLIEANPLFRDKLNFPTLKNSRLRTLINQRFRCFCYPGLIFLPQFMILF